VLLGRVVFFVHFALCAVVECQKEYLACDEVLALLSVWSKMQIFCVWSIRCYCPPKPHYLASLKFRMVLRSLYRLTQVILQYDLGLEYDLGEQLNGQLNGCYCYQVVRMLVTQTSQARLCGMMRLMECHIITRSFTCHYFLRHCTS